MRLADNALSLNGATTHHVNQTWTMETDKEYLFGVGHMHSGALNVSVYHNGEYVCSSFPVYGKTPGVAGDEKGHLVEVTRCLEMNGTAVYDGIPPGAYRNTTLRVKKGDTLRVDGWYNVGPTDDRIAPMPAGPHLGVMSYFFGIYVNGTI